MSKSRPPHIDTHASLSPAHRALLQKGADTVGAHLKLEPGADVAVVYDGQVYLATLSENVRTISREINLCPIDICRKLQHEINEYCVQNGLPTGTPFPVLDNGKVCYCVCCR